MNATDRVDAPIEESLVRAVSHQPYSLDLAPLQSIRSHVSRVSQHAHFIEPELDRAKHSRSDSADATVAPSDDGTNTDTQNEPRTAFDIEHVPVDDDPRDWSPRKKSLVMALMTAAVVSR